MSGTDALVARAVAASPTVAAVEVGRGALGRIGALVRGHFGPGPCLIVSDGNTDAAAGQAARAALERAGIACAAHVLPARPRPKPTVALAGDLRAVLARSGAVPVAVGSGVLNDVVKHAAHALGRPYLIVATAASMDGYTSAGAPLSDRGFKMTIQCAPPRVVVADLDVIGAAPPAMNGWGYGDLAGKMPAGGDWLVADALGVEPLDAVAWPMVQDNLRDWLARPEAVAAGEPRAIADLFAGLTLGGLAMEAHGSSRPASGAEHQIAHLWEMEDLAADGERVAHGACVAVGTVASLRLYDWLLAQDLGALDAAAILGRAPGMAAKEAAIVAAFGEGELARRATQESRAKHADPATHAARLERLARAWPGLRDRLAAHLWRAGRMADHLARAGCPHEAAQIGVDAARLAGSIRRARFLRSRYTVLDLLDETGLLDQAVAATVPQGG